MTRVVCSLTAIPPRFHLLDEVLHSLLDQTAAVEAVYLNLPRSYRRFNFDPTKLPKVPKGVTIRLVDTDYGPATKVLPTVQAYRGQDCAIFFCDDDKVYAPDTVQNFLDAAAAHPGCCIIEEGGDVADNSNHAFRGALTPRSIRRRKDIWYRLRRAASLGRWKPKKTQSSGYADILEGWGGVLVRPEFFTPAAFDIPDLLWMVDDIWLSGQLALNNVPIWLNADIPFRTRGNSDEVITASLRKTVVEGLGRKQLNQACIDYYRDTHGIWGGKAV